MPSAAFVEDLRYIEQAVRDQYQFAPWRGMLASVTAIPEWAAEVQTVKIESFGRVVPQGIQTDVGHGADVRKSKSTIPLIRFESEYVLLDVESQRAAATGIQYGEERAIANSQAWEAQLDRIAAIGDEWGTIGTGLANAAGVPVVTPTTPGWATATALQIVRVLNQACDALDTNTKQIYQATDLALSLALYQAAASTYHDNTATTALDIFKKQRPGVTLHKWNRLDGVGAGGLDRIVTYNRDPLVARMLLPRELSNDKTLEIKRGILVPQTGVTGGVQVRAPKGMSYTDCDPTT